MGWPSSEGISRNRLRIHSLNKNDISHESEDDMSFSSDSSELPSAKDIFTPWTSLRSHSQPAGSSGGSTAKSDSPPKSYSGPSWNSIRCRSSSSSNSGPSTSSSKNGASTSSAIDVDKKDEEDNPAEDMVQHLNESGDFHQW